MLAPLFDLALPTPLPSSSAAKSTELAALRKAVLGVSGHLLGKAAAPCVSVVDASVGAVPHSFTRRFGAPTVGACRPPRLPLLLPLADWLRWRPKMPRRLNLKRAPAIKAEAVVIRPLLELLPRLQPSNRGPVL